jgi:hypothetical protein
MCSTSSAYDGIALPVAAAQFFVDDGGTLLNANAIRDAARSGASPTVLRIFFAAGAQMLMERASRRFVFSDIFIPNLILYQIPCLVSK